MQVSAARRLAVISLLAFATLGAGAALAGSEPDPDTGDTDLGTSGLRYSSDSEAFNLSNLGYARAVAGCGPETLHTAGGGVKLTGPGAADRRHSTTAPYDWYDLDTAPEDGWVASGYGQSAGTLTTFAICISKPQPTYLTSAVADSDHRVRSAERDCEPGDGKAIAGGGSIATSESFMSQSYPTDDGDGNATPDDGWAIRVYDTVDGMGGMSLRVVCHSGPVTYASSQDSAGPGHGASATAPCTAGTHVAGGGAKMSGPGGQVHLAGTHPVDGEDGNLVPDDGWKASGFNDSSRRRTLTTFATCIP